MSCALLDGVPHPLQQLCPTPNSLPSAFLMLVYPIALLAALLLGALNDLSAVLLAPTLARFNLPLVSVAPYYVHSFEPLPRLGAPTLLNASASLYHHVSLAMPTALSTSALVDISTRPSALALTLTHTHSSPPPPLYDTTTPAHGASFLGHLVTALVVCCYLALLYWIALGTALVACYCWYRVAAAVDVQRMDSVLSLYSVGLLAETSDVLRFGAPGRLEFNLARVPRTARFLRPVPPAPVIPPPSPAPPAPTKVKEAHRGCRGGQREQRRRLTQLRRELAALAPSPAPQSPGAGTPQLRPSVWDFPVDISTHDAPFATNGSGRVVNIGDDHTAFFIDPPPSSRPSTPTPPPPTPSAPLRPPTPIPTIPPSTPKTIVGRTYSHCDTPPKVPAITTFRRKPAPRPTLASVAVRVTPAGKLNQRARRALTAQRSVSLGNFVNAR
ncbi:hypothetical protein C8Q78DRAFT_1082041 [Trametes maxima]|nr:hypothetical protein C8Q78DRAFT_1082041 [Trametes maxima]